MITTAMPCIIYCRVSSRKQVTEGDGLQSQEKRCRDYAAAKGYTVLRVFQEKAVTGAASDRLAMDEVLAFLDEQDHETIVIIDDLKRWARDVEIHFDLKLEIYKRNGRLESPSFRFEDTPEGKFIETIIAAHGELERNQNKRQVFNRMKARLEQGFWVFYHPPGYRYKHHAVYKKCLVLDEHRAGFVQEALQGFADGRFTSAMDVYRFLRDNGFFGLQRSKSITRHVMLVHRMLRQIIYTGYIEYRPWNIGLRKGHHPALITLEQFQRIQEKLASRNRPVFRKDTREDFPLRNFIACTGCGYRLTGSWTKGKSRYYAYYHCSHPECDLKSRCYPKAEVETAFTQLLGTFAAPEDAVELARDRAILAWEKHAQQRINASEMVAERLNEIGEELERLSQVVSRSKNASVSGVFEEQIEKLVRERETLESKGQTPEVDAKEFATHFDQVKDIVLNPAEAWNTGDLRTKRLITSMVFPEAVTYSRDTGYGTPKIAAPYLVFQRIAGKSADIPNLVDIKLETSENRAQLATDQIDHNMWMEFIDTISKWAQQLNPGFSDATLLDTRQNPRLG